MPNWLGDMVMATAMVRALREAVPIAQIDIIVKKGLHEVGEYLQGVDNQYIFSKSDYPGLIGAFRFGRMIKRSQTYDCFLCLPNSFSSAVMAFGSGAAKRVGFRKELRSFLLTHTANQPKGVHRVIEYLELIQLAGWRLPLIPKVHLKNASHREPNKLVININSEAISRRLPIAKAVEILNYLTKQTAAEMVLVGAPKEVDHVATVLAQVETPERFTNLAGTTSMHQLIQTLGGAHVVLTTDSGPMHIANALGVFTIVMEGGGDEMNTGPFNQENRSLLRYGQLPCEPCVKNTCQFGLPKCLESLSTQNIVAEVVRCLMLPIN